MTRLTLLTYTAATAISTAIGGNYEASSSPLIQKANVEDYHIYREDDTNTNNQRNLQACFDDDPKWQDSEGITCASYSPARCEISALFINNRRTGKDNCCSCGGGNPVQPNKCYDLRLDNGMPWSDSYGNNCFTYELTGACATHSNCCQKNSFTASIACCACGGGTREQIVDPDFTNAPSGSPTALDACADPFNAGSGCTCEIKSSAKGSGTYDNCADGLFCNKNSLTCIPL